MTNRAFHIGRAAALAVTALLLSQHAAGDESSGTCRRITHPTVIDRPSSHCVTASGQPRER